MLPASNKRENPTESNAKLLPASTSTKKGNEALTISCRTRNFVGMGNNASILVPKSTIFQRHHVVEQCIIIEFSESCLEGLIFLKVEERVLVCKVDSSSTSATPEKQVGVVLQEPDGEANLCIHKEDVIGSHLRDLDCVD